MSEINESVEVQNAKTEEEAMYEAITIGTTAVNMVGIMDNLLTTMGYKPQDVLIMFLAELMTRRNMTEKNLQDILNRAITEARAVKKAEHDAEMVAKLHETVQ